MTITWCMFPEIWSMTVVILTVFCPFTPKNQNLKKMKKMPGEIIILHKCTKNHDHMLHCSWDMVSDRCNYFSFWAIFCPFTQKIKIKKKWKKSLEISSLYASVPKIMTICYLVPEIWCVTDVIVIFHFGYFLPFYPIPINSPKNQN